MNKKIAALLSVLIILAFIGYMIFDTIRPQGLEKSIDITVKKDSLQDFWKISREFKVENGSLKAVTVSPNGNLFLAAGSFVSSYDKDLKPLWNLKTPYPITSLSIYGDTLFASSSEKILIISSGGKIKDEWGPFEDYGIITSVTSNNSYIAFADAGNKIVFVLDKTGRVKTMIGQKDGQFIVPSPYFDVALDSDNTLYVANTGHRRIEIRTIEGAIKSHFGDPGMAPGAFCGCCNPAHFILVPNGFVTAEKGINRIKILNKSGEFVEYVSSKNKFTSSIPLDLASIDGKTIYAANPADSKLYIFTRK
jgi:WD40 repeat protein